MCFSMSYVFILQHYLRQLEPCYNPANQLMKSIKFHGKQNRHLCHYVEIMRVCKKEWWKTILFDPGPSTKDDFHLRWKESSECNWVLFTRDMACTPCKEDFPSPTAWANSWYIYLLGDGIMTPTGTDQNPAQLYILGVVYCSCRTATSDTASVYILNRPMHQCTNVTLDPWWDRDNAISKGIIIILYQWIQPNSIYSSSLDKDEFKLLLIHVLTTVMCAPAEWDSGSYIILWVIPIPWCNVRPSLAADHRPLVLLSILR